MLLTELIQFIKHTHRIKNKESFQWTDEGLVQYLSWAFSRDYLFIDSDENGLTGCLVVYPLPSPSDGSTKSLLPSDSIILRDDEISKELVLMDMICNTSKSRHNIMNKFMKRFPNWMHQKKWAGRRNTIKVLENRWVELTSKLN